MHSLLTELLFSKMYLVTLSSISGDAGDSLVDHNDMEFSTKNEDHDKSIKHCAVEFESAWWYNDCDSSSLNGRYSTTSTVSPGHGIQWSTWKNNTYSLKKSEMKTRPSQFSKCKCLNFLTVINLNTAVTNTAFHFLKKSIFLRSHILKLTAYVRC